jgi:hypothetical protein
MKTILNWIALNVFEENPSVVNAMETIHYVLFSLFLMFGLCIVAPLMIGTVYLLGNLVI